MSRRDRIGFIGLILTVGGFSALGNTWSLIVPGLFFLGLAASPWLEVNNVNKSE